MRNFNLLSLLLAATYSVNANPGEIEAVFPSVSERLGAAKILGGKEATIGEYPYYGK